MPALDADLLRRDLTALLQQQDPGTYPYAPGEDDAAFQAASLNALSRLLPRFDEPAGWDHSLGSALRHALDCPMPAGLARQPGRRRLVGAMLRNAADPGRINQGHKGTCAVTCVEIYLAERKTAEYLRIVAELMDLDGEARLLNGDLLKRDEEHLRWSRTEAGRSPASRLFQVAAMDYAYPDLDYQNDQDSHVDTGGESTGSGMGLDEFDRLLEGVTGERWERLSTDDARVAERLVALGIDPDFLPNLRRDGAGIIRRSLAAGDPVFVTLEAKSDDTPISRRVGIHPLLALPHKVRVLQVDDAAGRVHYDDPLDPSLPWMPDVATKVESKDGRCSMASDDFFGLVVELSCHPEHLGIA